MVGGGKEEAGWREDGKEGREGKGRWREGGGWLRESEMEGREGRGKWREGGGWVKGKWEGGKGGKR